MKQVWCTSAEEKAKTVLYFMWISKHASMPKARLNVIFNAHLYSYTQPGKIHLIPMSRTYGALTQRAPSSAAAADRARSRGEGRHRSPTNVRFSPIQPACVTAP
jgi:hypothetical protein